MVEDLKKTVRILQKPRTGADGSDRNVWSAPIESDEFELVSTMMLQQILEADDGSAKKQLDELADFDVEGTGLLARNAENNNYEIVDGEDDEELSLVSTQMLQCILKNDHTNDDSNESAAETLEVEGGFDPYNSS